jgi:hypothetical protein
MKELKQRMIVAYAIASLFALAQCKAVQSIYRIQSPGECKIGSSGNSEEIRFVF